MRRKPKTKGQGDKMKNKEKIYDEMIKPHMTEIIKICKENDIAMIAEFYIPTDEKNGLCVSSAVENKGGFMPKHMSCMGFIQQKVKRT